MSILVVGGTGRVGTALVAELVARDVAFRVMARDPAAATRVFGGDVTVVHGDFTEPETVQAAVAGANTVFLLTPNVDADACAPQPRLQLVPPMQRRWTATASNHRVVKPRRHRLH